MDALSVSSFGHTYTNKSPGPVMIYMYTYIDIHKKTRPLIVVITVDRRNFLAAGRITDVMQSAFLYGERKGPNWITWKTKRTEPKTTH